MSENRQWKLRREYDKSQIYGQLLSEIQSFAFKLDKSDGKYEEMKINKRYRINGLTDFGNESEQQTDPETILIQLCKRLIQKKQKGIIMQQKEISYIYKAISMSIHNIVPNKADNFFKLVQKAIYQLLYIIILDRQNFGEEHILVLKGMIGFKRVVDKNIIFLLQYIKLTMSLPTYKNYQQVEKETESCWRQLNLLHFNEQYIGSGFKYKALLLDLIRIQFEVQYSNAAPKNSNIGIMSQIIVNQKNREQEPFEKILFCFSEADKKFFTQYLQIVKQYLLRDEVDEIFYINLVKPAIRIWQMNLQGSILITFLMSLLNNEFTVKIFQMKCIIKCIITSDIINLFEQNLDILPSFSFLGPQIQQKLFISYYKYLKKLIDRKQEENMQLFNTIFELRIKNLNLKKVDSYVDNNLLLHYFQKYAHLINSYNIRLLYECQNQQLKYSLLNILIKIIKNKQSLNVEVLQKYLFTKIETISALQTSLQLIMIFHSNIYHLEKLKLDFVFVYPSILLRTNLRKLYNNNVIPFYKANKEHISYDTYLMIITLESILQEQDVSDWMTELRYELYKVHISQQAIWDDLLTIFKYISKKTSTLMLIDYIFYGSVNNIIISNLQEVLNLIYLRISTSPYQLINLYCSDSFREILYIYNLKIYEQRPEILKVIEQILIKWIPYLELKEICFWFESAKFQYISDFFKNKIRFLKYLAIPQFSSIFSTVESRFTNFLKFYLKVINQYDIKNLDEVNIVKSSYFNDIKFKQMNQYEQSSELRVSMLINPNPSLRYNVIKIKLDNIKYQININNPQKILRVEKNITSELKNLNAQDIGQNLKIILYSNRERVILKVNQNEYEFKRRKSEALYKMHIHTSDSFLIQVQVNRMQSKFRNSISMNDSYHLNQSNISRVLKTITFDLNETTQINKDYLLKISQLNYLKMGNIKQYLDPKYLFALLCQMLEYLKNQSEQELNLEKAFQFFFEITFIKIEKVFNNFNQSLFCLDAILHKMLQKKQYVNLKLIQRFIHEKFSNQNYQYVNINKFIVNILLNFQIWIKCQFAIQTQIIQMLLRLCNLPKFYNVCKEIKLFQILLDINANYYRVTKVKQNFLQKNGQKLEFQKYSESLLIKLIQNDDISDLTEKLNYLAMLLHQRESNQKDFDHLFNSCFKYILQQIFIQNPLINNEEQLKKGESSKQKISRFFRQNKFLPILMKYLQDKKLRIVIIRTCLLIIDSFQDIEYATILKSVLNDVSQQQYLLIYEDIKLMLKNLNKKIDKRGYFKYNISIVQLLAFIISKFQVFQSQELIVEEILAIMLNYTEVYSKIQEESKNLKSDAKSNASSKTLSELFTKEIFIDYFIWLMNTCNHQYTFKISKIIHNYICLLFDLNKIYIFKFLQIYRKKANGNVNVLLCLIKFVIKTQNQLYQKQVYYSKKWKLSNIFKAVFLQFCFETLVVTKNHVTQKQKNYISQIIIKFLKMIIINQTGKIAKCTYSTLPKVGDPIFKNDCIKNFSSKGFFQIKSGIFYKVLIVIFKLFEINPSIQLIILLQLIFQISNDVIQSIIEQPATKSLIFLFDNNFNKNIQKVHDIKKLIQQSNNEQLKEDYQIELGSKFYDLKNSQISIDDFCLEYTYVKLQLLSNNLMSAEIKNELKQLVKKLIKKYKCLQIEKQFIKSKSIVLFNYDSYLKKINKVPSSKDENKQITSTEELVIVSEKIIPYSTPKKRLSLSSSRKIEIQDLDKNVTPPSVKLLELEYIFTYLIQKDINYQPSDALSQVNSKFHQYMENNQIQNKVNEEDRKYYYQSEQIIWKKFISLLQTQDGIFYYEKFKKNPVIKLKNIQLPDYTRPITTLTSAYHYQLQRKINFDNNLIFSIYHEIVKNQSFTFEEHVKFSQFMENQITDEKDDKILVYKCQLIKRIGAYYCQMQINQLEECIKFRSLKQKRPTSGQYIYGVPQQNLIYDTQINITINLINIAEIYVRKFNQIPNIAIQIFMKKGKSYYFMLYNKNYVYRFLSLIDKFFTKDQIIINPFETFQKRKYTQKWQNNQLSNFQYLMIINRFSSRSYNDTSQPYIFPWVLNNYQSQSINIYNPQVYRDLSLPVASINPKKLEHFKEKLGYQDHLYNIFFSTSMALFYFLIRIEPYSSLARTLQGNRFDVADRMFTSIPNVWRAIFCQSNEQDIKELIPQFYYLPTFLENKNQIILGYNQANKNVNNVELPPWANKNPNRFISIMRAALQSDFVSERLPQWINMIFGVHQYSLEKNNTFKQIFYEQKVQQFKHLKKEDILLKIREIYYFGQFPSSLFKKEHPIKIKSIKRLNTLQRKKDLGDIYINGMIYQMLLINKKIYLLMKILKKPLSWYILDQYGSYEQINEDIFSAFKQITLMKKKYLSLYLQIKQITISSKPSQKISEKIQQKILTTTFLKKLSIIFAYKKAKSNSRFIAFCGKSFRIMDFQGVQYFYWNNQQTSDCLLFQSGCVFVTNSGKLYKYNYINQYLQILYEQKGNKTKKYDIKLNGFQDNLMELFVLIFDKNKIKIVKRFNHK